MPKSQYGKAKAALAEIWNAVTRADAIITFNQFVDTYTARYPKTVEKLVKDCDELLAFHDFPVEHWQHVRATNPLESTFATAPSCEPLVSLSVSCDASQHGVQADRGAESSHGERFAA
jgi:transposase-like protein